MTEKVLHKTPAGVCAMGHVFEKWGYKTNTPKFGIHILLEKGVQQNEAWLKAMQTVIQECINTKWPDPKTRPRKPQLPIKNGDTWETQDGIPKIEKSPYLENMWVIVLSGDDIPTVLDINGVILDKDTGKGKIYNGMVGQGLFDMFAYETGSKGVSFGFKAFKKNAEGDRLATGGGGDSAMSATDAQKAFGVEPSDPDSGPNPDSDGAEEVPAGSMWD